MDQPQEKPRRTWPPFLLLLFVLLALYLSNLRVIASSDTVPSRYLPLNIVLHGNFYLDTWAPKYLKADYPVGPYCLAMSRRGHLMSAYPIIMPVVLTPLYVLPAWWLHRQPPVLGPVARALVVETMEKVSAALMAALSAGILFLALRKVADSQISLLVSAIYGAASETWVISSQALWRHGFTELALALLLWALLRDPQSRGYGFWVGLSLAMAAANNPLYMSVVLIFLLCFVLQARARFWEVLLPLVILGGLVLAYNLYFFGSIYGGYFKTLQTTGTAHYVRYKEDHPLWEGLLGLFISPSRGLLVYMPWALFCLWGAVRFWRENRFFWSRYLLLSLAAVILVHASYGGWWAGWCYGPRYFTDVTPFLAFLLIPVWPVFRARSLMRMAMGVAVAIALWVQMLGAYQYRVGIWDGVPNDVNYHQERLWDWTDTQIAQCWAGGMLDTVLDDRWSFYFEVKNILARRGLIPSKSSSPRR